MTNVEFVARRPVSIFITIFIIFMNLISMRLRRLLIKKRKDQTEFCGVSTRIYYIQKHAYYSKILPTGFKSKLLRRESTSTC